jgi:hypothetical protein
MSLTIQSFEALARAGDLRVRESICRPIENSDGFLIGIEHLDAEIRPEQLDVGVTGDVVATVGENMQ